MISVIARRMCGSFSRRVSAIASSNAAPDVAATAEAGACMRGSVAEGWAGLSFMKVLFPGRGQCRMPAGQVMVVLSWGSDRLPG